ncbi:LysM peptidoglycan-binding domain-containing protein [Pedobacter sp. MC2016-05]|nr:LysM peptidoglycan-binding domain-containing protein [Pedobacter sp. MC2016-05]
MRNETIFTVAKQYGITAYQLRKLNNLPDNAITIGQVLKVPGGIVAEVEVPKEKQAEPVKASSASPSKEESFIHTVATGENIFSIAKKYNLTAYQIRTANKLDDNAIKVDQKLIIPKPPQPKSVNEASKEEQESEPDSTMVKDPKLRRDPSVYGLSQIEEKGAAVWIADADLDGSKMLVLHRTAPVGRVIKITNPMTNKTTFAKVVGKFTENESTKDVIIVMTKAVADSLGALDKRFFCNLTYSAQ